MQFQNLASHPDIGASSYLVEAGDTRVILDAGTHPKHTGKATLPLFDLLAPDSVDAILLTHPHLDHIGGLPLLMRQHRNAAVAMTEVTRENGGALLHNSVNVMKAQREELNEPSYPLYTHREVDEAERSWFTREVGAPFSIGDLDRISCEFFQAGHVLGAVGIALDFQGHRFFYTGDVHFEDQTLTRGASFPTEKLNTLVMETTRGDHPRNPGYSRETEKRRLAESINLTLERGGAVMIPVFAFGKTQELLLMLRELIDTDEIPPVPVHIGGLSTKMTQIADRFSLHPGRKHKGFSILEDFPSLQILARGEREPDLEAGSIYALSSGMMSEHTVSHRFARRILSSPKHSLLFVGYADHSTPGGRILAAGKGGRVALSSHSDHETEIKCDVYQFDFSGHATRDQLADYAFSCNPDTVILVHGDQSAREWFQGELNRRLPQSRILIPAPGEKIVL